MGPSLKVTLSRFTSDGGAREVKRREVNQKGPKMHVKNEREKTVMVATWKVEEMAKVRRNEIISKNCEGDSDCV